MSVCLVQLQIGQTIEITSPPQNAVAVAGTSLQLTCGINQPYEGYFEWRTYPVGKLGGKQIYSSSTFSSSPFTAENPRYQKFGDFGLEINPIEWRDAGKYSCNFLTGDVRQTANVIVMG